MRKMPKLVARAAPWLIAVGVLALLLHRTPLRSVLAHVRSAAPWTLPVGILGVVAIFLCDCFAISRTFGWFVTPLRFADVLLVRGASYLLAAVNYSVGQGAIVYFVHRVAGVSVSRGTGTVLLIMGTNLLLLLGIASAGLLAAPHVPSGLVLAIGAAYVGFLCYALVLYARPRWLREKPVVEVLLEAGPGGHLKAALVRSPHLVGLIGFHYAMLRAFGIDVPPGQAILLLPILFFIAVLPISVQGLGTTQAAAVLFFSDYAPGPASSHAAAVLAYSLAAQVVAGSVQCLIGVACLPTWAGRMVRKRGEPVAPDLVSHETDTGTRGTGSAR